MDRYFISADDNSAAIWDRLAQGDEIGRPVMTAVDCEPLGIQPGEDADGRERRLLAQIERCHEMNTEDARTRRQYGEPMASFVQRYPTAHAELAAAYEAEDRAAGLYDHCPDDSQDQPYADAMQRVTDIERRFFGRTRYSMPAGTTRAQLLGRLKGVAR